MRRDFHVIKKRLSHGTVVFGIFGSDVGNFYRAEFVAGSQKGKGEFMDLRPEGVKDHRVGDMVRFQMNGNGIQRLPNGSRYIGPFKDNEPEEKTVR